MPMNGEDPDAFGGSSMHPNQSDRDDKPPVVAKLNFLMQLFRWFNFAKKKTKKKSSKRDKLSAEERLVMRDHEIRFRCLLTASQAALSIGNPVGVDQEEWHDDEEEFDYCIEDGNEAMATGLAILSKGIFSHRPTRPDRRFAYFGVRRNGEKWNPRFFGFDF